MRQVDVVLLYEHVAREMDVACAIKYLMASRHGLHVEIVQQPFGVSEALATLHPRLVVLPFCYSNSILHYPLLFDWFDAVYFNMAWEELFYEGNRASKLPQGYFETQNVLHHTWGDFFVKILVAQGVNPQHIFHNGNPSYTLYQEPYRKYFDQRADLASRHKLDPAKRWIFFPENYNWAFYADWRLEELQRFGVERDHIDEMVRFCRDSFKDVMGWCNSVADADSVEVIVRPRPATPLEEFRRATTDAVQKTADRMHIIKEESVREWIMASDVVVSSYSTSLIEAAVAGKAAYMVEPYPIPQSLSMDWHHLLPHLHTYAEFQNAAFGLDSDRDNRLRDWAGETMMSKGDSISNLVEYLAGLCRGEVRKPPRPKRWSVMAPGRYRLPAWLRFEYYRRRDSKNRRTPSKGVSQAYEMDMIASSEIEDRVSKWARVLE
jgi:surface carbohydrate biosynthesis protein